MTTESNKNDGIALSCMNSSIDTYNRAYDYISLKAYYCMLFSRTVKVRVRITFSV